MGTGVVAPHFLNTGIHGRSRTQPPSSLGEIFASIQHVSHLFDIQGTTFPLALKLLSHRTDFNGCLFNINLWAATSEHVQPITGGTQSH